MVSTLGIAIMMAVGIYSLFGYLDPSGMGRGPYAKNEVHMMDYSVRHFIPQNGPLCQKKGYRTVS